MSPTQPLAEAQESMTADQRLNLLLTAAEQQVRENEAAAARARIFGTDHLGQQEHNAFSQCHPNGSVAANVITQCNPNGSASSSSGYANVLPNVNTMPNANVLSTQCRPNGLASVSTIAANTILLEATSSTNLLQCHPNGSASINQGESE